MAYTTINKSSDYFNIKLYTGNFTDNTDITGVGFQPDLVWLKERSSTSSYLLQDAVRGANKDLFSNETSDEESNTNRMKAFISDGFTLGAHNLSNQNGETYASWNWKANGTGSANTAGSINSTVSANTTSGFSIVKWTLTSIGVSTIGHGLGAIPKMIITKKITSGNPDYWTTYNKKIGSGRSIFLNDPGGESGASTSYWNDTSPTSSVFSTGTYFDPGDYIAYCFADVQGYSKFGHYAGTSSEVFNYTGFKPRFILIKKISEGASWHLFDTSRTVSNGGNQLNKILFPNLGNAESDDNYNYVDAYSNGFRCFSGPGGQGTETNKNGHTFIYMAFAEAPLVGTNNVPCTAR
jgi:hypothetical protein